MSFVSQFPPLLALPRTVRHAPLVLVADDEPLVREVTLSFLRRDGIEAVGAADGDAFLEAFARRAFECDAVVLDARMPGPPLDELIRQVRAWRPGLPVIVATGDVVAARSRVGALSVTFLEKPFRLAELAGVLECVHAWGGVA